jgi:inosine-uridine nucleoside N-ribohydrolase
MRAKIVAKLLDVTGRTDIPVGIGPAQDPLPMSQAPWAADYDLAKYPGRVYADGASAIVDTIMQSPRPITLISIGPCQTVAAALAREPQIAHKARFVGMHGSVYRGHELAPPGPMAEYNVRLAPQACQATYAAAWPKTMTPLDTCGIVRLTGEKYAKVAACSSPVARAVIEGYRVWLDGRSEAGRSSILFDCVAIYLAFSQDLLKMQRMGITISDDGWTRPDDNGYMVDVAIEWKDLGAFEDLIVSRICQ